MPTAKITRKGQLTIPAEFRKKLGTDIVEIVMEGNRIIIKPEARGHFAQVCYKRQTHRRSYAERERGN